MYNSLITVGRVNKPKQGMYNIKVDRTSVLGNPHFMHNESMRDEVCDKHLRGFTIHAKVKGSPIHTKLVEIYNLVKAGNRVSLNCHCAPKRCHADSIKMFLDSHLEKL